MWANANDTIVAAATAPEPGERAVVRLSGPGAIAISESVFESEGGPLHQRPPATPRRLAGVLSIRRAGSVPASAWLFPAGRSYTGEDVVELHVPGWPTLVSALVEDLLTAGCRLADPGEFTRRAWMSGRMDLTEAEAVATLIGAAGEREARAALRQVEGGLRLPVEALISDLLDVTAHLEAGIDFSEEDVPLLAPAELAERLAASRAKAEEIAGSATPLATCQAAGARVLLCGCANVGKSSLFNALLGSQRSLVDAQSGTTLDAVSAVLTLPDGQTATLVDPPGHKTPADELEARALERAETEAQRADLLLEVHDLTNTGETATMAATSGCPRLLVINKADLQHGHLPTDAVTVSALTGQGIDSLRQRIALELSGLAGGVAASGDYVLNARHAQALAEAISSISAAESAIASGQGSLWDLAAIDVRRALDHLGMVTGEVTTDDVLDRVFDSFCVGK